MQAGVRSYSIKDLESFCGIKAHTIRMWEKRYGILSPDRSDTNIRTYTEDELKKIITISILNRNGLKISRIASMNDEEILHAVMKKTAVEEETQGDFKPGPLIMSALRFSETHFRKSLQPHIDDKGFEEAYIKVFHPLMQKARTLWLTDCLSTAQEQFICYIIRSLIITADQALKVPVSKEAVVIINIGDTNPHGTLLFMNYILRKRGFDVVYTDGTLTTGEIAGIQLIKPFSVLALNVPAAIPDDEVKAISISLVKQLELRKIIILGRNEPETELKDNKTEIVCTPAEMTVCADNL